MSLRIEATPLATLATLDAPATRNALSDETVAALLDALEAARQAETMRAFVIRGAGGVFSAGGDFTRFRALIASGPPADAPDPIVAFNRAFGTLLESIADAPLLTIAVVDGAAIGGGAGLAAACDLVLASTNARFACPEVTLGLPPAQIAPFVAARIGPLPALRLMASGRRLNAEEAQALGLVDEVLWPDALNARLATWLADLQRAEPNALRATKDILRRCHTQPRGDVLDVAAERFASSLRSGTASEGLAAFNDKRSPRWAAEDAP
jgi:isohexenylglutaconyl-CoA hydratase